MDFFNVSVHTHGPFSPAQLSSERGALVTTDLSLHQDVLEAGSTWVEVWCDVEYLDPASVPMETLNETFFCALLVDLGLATTEQLQESFDEWRLAHVVPGAQWAESIRVTGVYYVDASCLPDDLPVLRDTPVRTSYQHTSTIAPTIIPCAPVVPAITSQVVKINQGVCTRALEGVRYFGTREGLYVHGDSGLEPVKLSKKMPHVHQLVVFAGALWVCAANGLHRIVSGAVTDSWSAKQGLPGRSALCAVVHGAELFVGCSGGYVWVDSEAAIHAHKDKKFANIAHAGLTSDSALFIAGKNGVYIHTPSVDPRDGWRDYYNLRSTSWLYCTHSGVLFHGCHGKNPHSFHLDVVSDQLVNHNLVRGFSGTCVIGAAHGFLFGAVPGGVSRTHGDLPAAIAYFGEGINAVDADEQGVWCFSAEHAYALDEETWSQTPRVVPPVTLPNSTPPYSLSYKFSTLPEA